MALDAPDSPHRAGDQRPQRAVDKRRRIRLAHHARSAIAIPKNPRRKLAALVAIDAGAVYKEIASNVGGKTTRGIRHMIPSGPS